MGKTHGSFGTMTTGKARGGKETTCDHPSLGSMPKGTGPYDPRSPSNGSPGNFEGGGGSATKLPKEKDYSRNGL